MFQAITIFPEADAKLPTKSQMEDKNQFILQSVRRNRLG